jgi:DNA-directed RNA polymerase subunit RPC12/RpoP
VSDWPEVRCGGCGRRMTFMGTTADRLTWVYRCFRCKFAVRLVAGE